MNVHSDVLIGLHDYRWKICYSNAGLKFPVITVFSANPSFMTIFGVKLLKGWLKTNHYKIMSLQLRRIKIS